jgi:hypothetical protein
MQAPALAECARSQNVSFQLYCGNSNSLFFCSLERPHLAEVV